MNTLYVMILLTFQTMGILQQSEKQLFSELCILDLSNRQVTTVMQAGFHLEAPNWTPDGRSLVYNSNGKLYSIPVEGGDPREVYSKFANKCNNDHVISPDGSMIAFSHHTDSDQRSRIYILPRWGGTPELITPRGPSYLHGWSPVKHELAYCAERNGQYDVYTIDINSKKEVQLTNEPGLDDGPEYSPDGKYIYFNSTRTGTMQIWRMKTDGSEPTQLTFDEKNDWFAHPSPDNRWLVFISYDPSVAANNHPANKEVFLRLMPVEGGDPEILLELFGGQGTINVPSWSPDSKKFAFVRYGYR